MQASVRRDDTGISFLQEIGYVQRFEGDTAIGWFEVTDSLRVPGSGQARAAVLATLSDVYTGVLAGAVVAPRTALTVDLTLRILADVGAERYDVVARVLRSGQRTTVAEAEFVDPQTGELVAFSHATFMASPRPQDLIALPGAHVSAGTMRGPISEELGIVVGAPGEAEVSRGAYVNQPTGTIQGGVLAVLAEVAAESLTSRRVVDLEVRYLSAIRVGPARATARSLNDETVRVEVRDAGNDDRLTTVVMLRVAR
jgi:acyl-coenzyme A thioesterase PaaI-like protein